MAAVPKAKAKGVKPEKGAATPRGVMKKKGLARPIARRALRVAMVQNLRKVAQKKRGNSVLAGDRRATKTAGETPIEQRAGHPLVPTAVHPLDWKTVAGKQVFVDLARVPWLPDDWGQGVKMTNPISRSRAGYGGTYTVWVSPCGRVFYHKWAAEDFLGRKLGAMDGFRGQHRLYQLQGKQTDEAQFLKLLSAKERAVLPAADELHFCVISARRTRTPQGLADIALVQAQFSCAGVQPTWYVDQESLEDYRKLGLNAVVGGKLVPARNLGLEDAEKLGRACVQVSDDLSRWEYHHGKQAASRSDDACNAAHAAAVCHVISPVTAARFLLAKLRAAGPEESRPRLAGVYPLGSCSRGFGAPECSPDNFILGDFFVADRSPVRFDTRMTLKEDYDFTCSHIQTHGSVLRSNRMTIQAKHQTNSGGACSVRDAKGLEEQKNMQILFSKWPRAIRRHTKRKNEVILAWPKEGAAKLPSTTQGKRSVKPVSVRASTRLAGEFPLDKVIVRGVRTPRVAYIQSRCNKAVGLTVREAVEMLKYKSSAGTPKRYGFTDLRYDIASSCLALA